jgi:transposase
MTKRLIINEEAMEALKKARQGNRDKHIEKWLHVMVLHGEGIKRKEICAQVGLSASRVGAIIGSYFSEGLEAVAKKHYTGNRRNITFAEEEALLEPFRKDAEAGKIVGVKGIHNAYEQAVGHKVGSGQISKLLARHGWRNVRPRSRHAKQADEATQGAAKRLHPR